MEHNRDDYRSHLCAAAENEAATLTRNYLAMQDQLAAVATELMRARRARVEELLEKERLADRMTQLLRVLPGAVLVLDDDGIVVECNSAAISLLGRPVAGQTWSEIVDRVGCRDAARAGHLRLADGRSLSLARRALEQESGEILLLTDITETERLHAVVQRQNRLSAMGEMSARLAHQVRTPLAAAVLYLSQLDQNVDCDPERRSRYVRRSLQRLRDLEALVDGMLIFAGGVQDTEEDVDLTAMLYRVVETLRPQVPEDTIVNLHLCKEHCRLAGNAAALQSAVSNLVMNAIQMTPAGAIVDIELQADADSYSIFVRDNGPGIPVEYHDRIFEPFFSTRSQGTGLGLAVVRTVANAHGGTVEVRDMIDGAELQLRFPRRHSAAGGALSSGLRAAQAV